MGEIRVGTSGWNYPAGPGSWNGTFYPPAAGRRAGFDELAYYAEHFDTVEVNVTFYRPLARTTARRWAERTPPGFDFSVKLHQRFTHATMEPVTGRPPHPPAPPPAAPPPALPAYTRSDVDEFRAGIEPLADAGKLGALLVQFPPSFRDEPATRAYLEALLRRFSAYPLAVELRHRSWSDRQAETLSLLADAGAALVQIDEPKFRFSIRQNYRPNTGSLYYMRLHGRNAAQWWRHEHRDERYNYLYSAEELEPIVDTAKAVRALVKKAYLYLNNHFAAKAVVNATVLKHELGEPVTGEYRPEMVERYPELRDLVPAGPAGRDSPTLFPR
jgi:uncharacterized protein YecE (DUF72 family)